MRLLTTPPLSMVATAAATNHGHDRSVAGIGGGDMTGAVCAAETRVRMTLHGLTGRVARAPADDVCCYCAVVVRNTATRKMVKAE